MCNMKHMFWYKHQRPPYTSCIFLCLKLSIAFPGFPGYEVTLIHRQNRSNLGIHFMVFRVDCGPGGTNHYCTYRRRCLFVCLFVCLFAWLLVYVSFLLVCFLVLAKQQWNRRSSNTCSCTCTYCHRCLFILIWYPAGYRDLIWVVPLFWWYINFIPVPHCLSKSFINTSSYRFWKWTNQYMLFGLVDWIAWIFYLYRRIIMFQAYLSMLNLPDTSKSVCQPQIRILSLGRISEFDPKCEPTTMFSRGYLKIHVQTPLEKNWWSCFFFQKSK